MKSFFQKVEKLMYAIIQADAIASRMKFAMVSWGPKQRSRVILTVIVKKKKQKVTHLCDSRIKASGFFYVTDVCDYWLGVSRLWPS